MSFIISKFQKEVSSLQTISEDEREKLIALTYDISRQLEEDSFKIRRLNKDKSIVVNILNATIIDLQKNKKQLEESNQQLHEQHKVLQQQTKLIEKNAQILSQNLKDLEFSYNELEQFSYVASHDLKSPLRTVASFAQLLMKTAKPKLDENEIEYINLIIQGATRMYDIINKLLEYSKVGDHSKLIEFLDLEDVFKIVKLNLKKEIEETNTELIICSNLPSIKGYKTNLIQLFQNLISNAIKFRNSKPPKIKIHCEPHLNGWKFQVKDNGIGIDEAYQNKVFEPFQRLNDSELPGSGIGLAICKKVVKMHKGNIQFQSKINEGTNFIFTLYSIT